MDDHLIRIRPMAAADWPAVRAIYAAGIATGHATFQSEPPTWKEFDAGHLPEHRWVAVASDQQAGATVATPAAVLGWCAVAPTSSRPVYAGVVEHSVYLAPEAAGRGVGTLLMSALIESTAAAGIWTLQSSVFPENTASMALHERTGFRVVGIRERIGLMGYGPMAGLWRDTILFEHRGR